jgi:hypothetical protein
VEILTVISGIAGITVIPMFGWVIIVERRLSRIEGYCKGRNCDTDKKGG